MLVRRFIFYDIFTEFFFLKMLLLFSLTEKPAFREEKFSIAILITFSFFFFFKHKRLKALITNAENPLQSACFEPKKIRTTDISGFFTKSLFPFKSIHSGCKLFRAKIASLTMSFSSSHFTKVFNLDGSSKSDNHARPQCLWFKAMLTILGHNSKLRL